MLPSERIKQSGWTQDEFQNVEGCRCVVGAFVDNPYSSIYEWTGLYDVGVELYGEDRIALLRDYAKARLDEMGVDPSRYTGYSDSSVLFHWNDSLPVETLEERLASEAEVTWALEMAGL